ncbi:MAG: bacillithiol system redox-active protein YtxJ [Balneolaceae bacterium]|nr:bacillithiol system redox-active protein YtxJ [Balneolaceae bacterium]
MGILDRIKNAFSGDDTKADFWNQLTEEGQVEQVIAQSKSKPQLIYKHSARCSVCWFAKSELENVADEMGPQADMNFVDVINSRNVSNKLAEVLNIRHESPQAILIKNGEAVWHESHGAIKGAKVLEQFLNVAR